MPPRDIFDSNPVYSRRFFWPYCEFIDRNSAVLGFIPSQLYNESEMWSDEREEVEEEEYEEDGLSASGFEQEDISSDTSDSSSSSSEEVLMDLTEEPYVIVQYIGSGQPDDPIDLTCDEEIDMDVE